jgi:PII-like signaling protein
MNAETKQVQVARIYVTEGNHVHEKIFQKLHDEHKVMGMTVYRGISGFGRSGETHSSNLLDMSFDLPVVIEFFDAAENVAAALEAIRDLIPPGNVLLFDAVNS